MEKNATNLPENTTEHKTAEPMAERSPPMDGKKPVAAGDKEIEKFLVATDSEGGD